MSIQELEKIWENIREIGSIKERLLQVEQLAKKIDNHLKNVKIYEWHVEEGERIFNFASRIKEAFEGIQREWNGLANRFKTKTSEIQTKLLLINAQLEKIVGSLNNIKDAIGFIQGDLSKVNCEAKTPYVKSGKGVILNTYKMVWQIGRLGFCVAGLLEKKVVNIFGIELVFYIPRPDRIISIIDSTIQASDYAMKSFQSLKDVEVNIRLAFTYVKKILELSMDITNYLNDILLDLSLTLAKTNELLLVAIFPNATISKPELGKAKEETLKIVVKKVSDKYGALVKPSLKIKSGDRVIITDPTGRVIARKTTIQPM